MSSEFGPIGPPIFSSDRPWLWVLIPVGVVVTLAGLAVWLHTRRRRRLHRLQQQRHEDGLPYNLRDTRHPTTTRSHGGTGMATTREFPIPSPPSPPLMAAWAPPSQPATAATGGSSRTRAARFGGGFSARQQEGLNEFGEAPPPYEKRLSAGKGDKAAAAAAAIPPRSDSGADADVDTDAVEMQSSTASPSLDATTTAMTTPDSASSVVFHELPGSSPSPPPPPPPPAYPEPPTAAGSSGSGGGGADATVVRPPSPALLPER
ncbi:hypothetical protein B0T26DRAFT_748657 [Lasiosphaeria miniovina]|uniref:Uncharacterized protein n=1 Tax=Lasiosphaeria miniovina TaxID=1954250 RepID=A0AA40E649_9PEZI|nr:uncharacterized protein B0T26DRAFT_748657 [Lasiosphaeria miniovina]KAK0728435.1 hypothetical protein B0T26DRAFT_748657 [Lasiosphaeria miniovina]